MTTDGSNGYFPLMLRLCGKRCLIVGGGRIAERKLLGLLEAGADDIRLISPSATERIERLAADGRIRLERRSYEPGDARDAWIVFAATDDRRINRMIAEEAEQNDILVNVADEARAGNFIAPSVVRRGDLLIAVTTAGASPALARSMKQELERQYGPEYGTAVRLLRQLRELALDHLPDARERKRLLELAAEEALAVNAAEDMDIYQWLDSLKLKIKGGNEQ